MKKLFLKVSQINGETIDLPCQHIDVNSSPVVVNDFLLDHPIPLLFEVKHGQINTLFDLTKVAPYEIWFFYLENSEVFFGKSFSLGITDSPFLIQTQAKFIVIVPCDYKDLNQHQIKATNNYVGFEINNSYLLDTEPNKKEKEDWTLRLFELTDQELINVFNKEIGSSSWGESRNFYLTALHCEIQNRLFHSDILFEYDQNVSLRTVLHKNIVQINNGVLEFKNV
jgi:hypothetical protein